MEFLWKDLKALGKQCHLRSMNRDLSGLCAEYLAFNTNNIAYIQLFKCFVCIFSDTVSCHIRLDHALQILHMAKGCLTHYTLGHHTSGDCYIFSFQFFKLILNILAVMCHIIFNDFKRILSLCLQFGKLLPADLQQLV